MSNKREECVFNQEEFISRLTKLIGSESYRSYSQRGGFSDTMLRSYVKDSIPSIEKAAQICAAAKVDDNIDFSKFFSWLCLGIGGKESDFFEISSDSVNENKPFYSIDKSDEFTLIDSYAIYASAGHGSEIGHELQTEPMSFRTDWLKKEGFSPDRLAVIRAKGDSMEPTISDNDVILVLLSNGDSPRDGLHVIRLESGLFVKRLQFDPLGSVYVKSDNPTYNSMTISKDERSQLHVVGRVVWAGKKF